jgi:hypothetical protein
MNRGLAVTEQPSMRLYAAVVEALAVARGELYSVSFGEHSKADVDRVLKATSLENIATTLGLREADIALDWNDYLSRAEVDSIKGFNAPGEPEKPRTNS